MIETLERHRAWQRTPNMMAHRVYHLAGAGMRRVRHVWEELGYRVGRPGLGIESDWSITAGVDLTRTWDWGRDRSFFFGQDSRVQVLATLQAVAPEASRLIVSEADQAYDHIFDLLGSGPTHLGTKIDWHVDFKSGHSWNPRTYYKRVRLAPYPGGYDIKVPWELSRCQHFVRLGQAHWITGEEKYAREFVAQVSDWIDDNPWPWGVNWACTMDVAIRAVNWLWGYHFFTESPSLSNEFRLNFYKSLLIHGRHIWRNLENQGDFTGNHYLSDLVGLVYLGILCPEFKEAQRWREFGLRELEQEMFKQVYPDGMNFEASVAYHRLATELCLSAVTLCLLNSIVVPSEVMSLLELMLDAVLAYIKPDGTAPLIGDSDNGRLLRLAIAQDTEREWMDHRYLLGVGAVLFGRRDFAEACGANWQDAIWLLGNQEGSRDIPIRTNYLPYKRTESQALKDSGLYIMRGEDVYLIANAGTVGQNGWGGHAHCDFMSFEFSAMGQNWIVDPGTFTYTMDYEARNLFRSTAAHNVMQLDLKEMHRYDNHDLFRLESGVQLEELDWETRSTRDSLYARWRWSSDRRCQSRSIVLEKEKRQVIVEDTADLWQSACIRLHFGIGVELHQMSDCSVIVKSQSSMLQVDYTRGWQLELLGGQVCRSYGASQPALVAAFSRTRQPNDGCQMIFQMVLSCCQMV